MAPQAQYKRIAGGLIACLAGMLVFAIIFVGSGCADWKFVRKSHLVNLAEGVEYVVNRVEPRPDLPAEEQEKVKRVSAKVLRNAKALAEVENEPKETPGAVPGAANKEP